MTLQDVRRYLHDRGLLTGERDHRDVEHVLRGDGWTPCGAGDWAVALRSPDGTAAARISPFDPTGPCTADLYERAAGTRRVPLLLALRRLVGGGDLQVLEWLAPVPQPDAVAFQQALAVPRPDLAGFAAVLAEVHAQARHALPWCGPLDRNPDNVRRASDGRLVLLDPFYADGPALYATAGTDPDRLVALVPESQRRFMLDIPLAASGPWDPVAREALRRGIAAADARAATVRP